MDYKEFKKEYYKTVKKVNAEMIKTIKTFQTPNEIIYDYSYYAEHSSFKNNFINNAKEEMPRIYFDIFQSVHFSILDAFKIELFSTGYKNQKHLVLPNSFSVSNLYDDNLVFVFNNREDISHIPQQTKIIINSKEIKIASSLEIDDQSPITITKNGSLEISSYHSNLYIFDDLAKKYLESVKDEISPKIKRIYDIANKFNIRDIQSFFVEHDLPNFFFLDDKNIEKNNEKIRTIKELMHLVHDVQLGEQQFNKDKNKILSTMPLKTKTKY